MKKNNEPKLRILMFLYEHQDEGFSQSELAKKLDLHYSTISVHIHQLEKDGYLLVQKGIYKNRIKATRQLCIDEDKQFIWKYI